MSNFVMSTRQAAELDYAFERNGWSPEEVKKLSTGDFLANVRQALLGYAEIKLVEHVINCDATPFVPDGWEVIEHQKDGQFQWNKDAQKDALFLSSAQKKGNTEGNKLRKELADKPVLNACVLDYLLAHPHLIPEEWKGKAIFFWGTIYRDSVGNLCVRYLYWLGDGWDWFDSWLGDDWSDDSPAALRAS
ncbi:hypothetical protein KGQ72_01995 [Patescibacteria group bacterium]|nr:hypothetical protein [Patescibacteria group bacterium]